MREHKLTRALTLELDTENRMMVFHRQYEKADFEISFERIEKIYRRWAADTRIDKERLAALTGATVAGLLLDWYGTEYLDIDELSAARAFIEGWSSGLTLA